MIVAAVHSRLGFQSLPLFTHLHLLRALAIARVVQSSGNLVARLLILDMLTLSGFGLLAINSLRWAVVAFQLRRARLRLLRAALLVLPLV